MNSYQLLAISLAVVAADALLEFLSVPKSRQHLHIPKGDWLSVSLGTVPGLGVAATALVTYFYPTYEPNLFLAALGFVLCAACVGIRTWRKLTLGRYYTFSIAKREDHKVIEEGPYRFVRHPLYLGAFLGVIGFPLLTQSWSGFLWLTLPTGYIYALRLYKEESYLMDNLGPEYRDYAKRVARLVPFIW